MRSYFAEVLVQTMYSTSSVYGLRKAKAEVRSQTQSRDLDRNRYMTDITCPFNLSTCSKLSFIWLTSSGWKKSKQILPSNSGGE